MKKVLYAASECVPFIKTGGLADVVGSLPKYMNQEEYDIRVILPKYRVIPDILKEKMEFMSDCWKPPLTALLTILLTTSFILPETHLTEMSMRTLKNLLSFAKRAFPPFRFWILNRTLFTAMTGRPDCCRFI